MMQNKVIGIISKRPERRSDFEIKAVLPWLRKKSEILSRSEDDVLVDIVRNCAYMKSLQDDVIVTQGDVGDWYVSSFTREFSDEFKRIHGTEPGIMVVARMS